MIGCVRRYFGFLCRSASLFNIPKLTLAFIDGLCRNVHICEKFCCVLCLVWRCTQLGSFCVECLKIKINHETCMYLFRVWSTKGGLGKR